MSLSIKLEILTFQALRITHFNESTVIFVNTFLYIKCDIKTEVATGDFIKVFDIRLMLGRRELIVLLLCTTHSNFLHSHRFKAVRGEKGGRQILEDNPVKTVSKKCIRELVERSKYFEI